MTVMENLELGAYIERSARARTALERVCALFPSSLSGATRKRAPVRGEQQICDRPGAHDRARRFFWMTLLACHPNRHLIYEKLAG